ncbi:MAG: P-II family nitrogen regulator [Bacteroidetes bacterium]|nr:MAG: P-II family nitrogen regulator [Bacteroidota bacterium]
MQFKKIQAVIRVSKFEDVRKSLHGIGIEYFTYHEVKGVSFQNEKKGTYRGISVSESAAVINKCLLEIIVPEIDSADVVLCIKKAAQTGEAGDGKIYVSDIESSIRI